MNKTINQDTGYYATHQGVKGILIYFYVYIDAWCFAPWDRRNDAGAFVQVDVEEVKIGGKL